MKAVILKPGKEKPLERRHLWIFSGAIESLDPLEPGELAQVRSATGSILGVGYFNPKCSLTGRMVCFGEKDPYKAIEENILKALSLRKRLFQEHVTTAYRLINGEGDLLPGLIVDRYGPVCVIQIGTWGMEKLKPFIIELLIKHLSPQTIYEKSTLPSRRQEGLQDKEAFLLGEQEEVTVLENGVHFLVRLKESQKTGLFLDQREMRKAMAELSQGKRVLNCFAYTGGFSVYCALAGASHVTTLDVSKQAISAAERNFALNHVPTQEHRFVTADCFEFLQREELDFDVVILDPPAFAKKKEDVAAASKGYLRLNRETLKKMQPGSLLLTCSCSYHVDETLFQKLLFQAALAAKKEVKILSKHRAALDHPVNLYHPESAYLKALLLEIH